MDTETLDPKAVEQFQSMFAPADLHPELAAYLVKMDHFEALQHPLVYSVPYHPMMNNHHNQRYEMLKAGIADSLKQEKPFRYVFQHERPYRLNAICDYIDKKNIKAGDYWELVGAVWSDSENIWQNLPIWRRLLRSERPSKFRFMDEDERKALKELPSQLTVYRGCVSGLNENGLSWTLDKDKATWFSARFQTKGQHPTVLTKTIRRRDVFAYLTGRNESEIIIL